MKTILVAIAKNEGQYIKEWALYHKLICEFDSIFVYNNDSSDNTQIELESLSNLGICNWVGWSTKQNNPPQQTAYAHALDLFKNEYDWICYLDLDEFLVLKSCESINNFIYKFDNKVGSVSFNWKMFYSLSEDNTKELVFERVNYAREARSVKSIARTNSIEEIGIHAPILFADYEYSHCSGVKYSIDYQTKANRPAGIDPKICRDPKITIMNYRMAQINHYKFKSKEEVLVSDRRGSADRPTYFKKNSIRRYEKLLQEKNHLIDNTIKTIIENKYGCERFSQLVTSKYNI